MRETKHLLFPGDFPAIKRKSSNILQVNLGYVCNMSCTHCHVNAGPNRTEIMSDETLEILIDVLSRGNFSLLDLTGGAPELHPKFRYLISKAHELGIPVRDRCNLTILFETEQEGLADFLATHNVEIVASLPCYTEKNVNQQRGKGVFQDSIRALKYLNEKGYAHDDKLKLHLVYNPSGPLLPPSQVSLQQDYKRNLANDFNIHFNELFVITNMPIQRFGSTLLSTGHFDSYMDILRNSHLDENLGNVMCRDTISVDWQGNIYDCDFNQMLDLSINSDQGESLHIRDLLNTNLEDHTIQTGNHCYGCTAGQGSSCSGALN
ncbi:MAG: arsenosugar biosynthesis radical SAM (seleno)protein ArsS [Pseudomonadota bacterium]